MPKTPVFPVENVRPFAHSKTSACMKADQSGEKTALIVWHVSATALLKLLNTERQVLENADINVLYKIKTDTRFLLLGIRLYSNPLSIGFVPLSS